MPYPTQASCAVDRDANLNFPYIMQLIINQTDVHSNSCSVNHKDVHQSKRCTPNMFYKTLSHQSRTCTWIKHLYLSHLFIEENPSIKQLSITQIKSAVNKSINQSISCSPTKFLACIKPCVYQVISSFHVYQPKICNTFTFPYVCYTAYPSHHPINVTMNA